MRGDLRGGLRLQPGRTAGGLFDARAGLGAHVQDELTAVGVRERNPGRATARAETPQRRPARKTGTKRAADRQALSAGHDRRLRSRSNTRSNAAGSAPEDCVRFGAVMLSCFSRYIASVGTSVRDRMYDASMAKTTASARGTNRYRATPLRKNMGRNTIQIQSVETSAGTAICAAPSRMAWRRSCPSSR